MTVSPHDLRSRPTVSVVTISYRDLPGLRRTLPSVQEQRGDFDIEHVVIDGGSGADAEQYLRSQDRSLAYWHSRPDRGRYDAMNLGRARSTGDLVWFMHSGDCFSDPGAVAAALDSIGGDGRAVLRRRWGYGRARLVDAHRNVTGTWGFVPFELRRFALGDRPIPHQAAFFGAAILDRLGDYDVEFGLAADQLYMLRAALLCPPVVLDRVVCNFDTTGAGSVRPLRDHYRDTRLAWDEAGYFPLGCRTASEAASRVVEVVAHSKLAARTLMRR
ncbi:glycosyltransferase [Rhodococcus aetherivorans]|uniref:glycosyltransferase n=1 Tax=Rhodococcus aetherivorans TaxID=191292 RepID=UPI000684D202|nr:glycosyltransferase [Rhodococcus aetherivorans]